MVKNFRISLVLISATMVFGLLASAALVNGDQGPAAAFADQRDALAAAVGWIMTEQQNDDGGFGVGFDTGKKHSGCGLENFKRRATEMNGKTEIHSAKGKGTKITFIVKIP